VLARPRRASGGAIVLPLTLTVISAAVPKEKRTVAIGIRGGISGLAVALGPVVGCVIVDGISWHWIFRVNVPFGIVLVPSALRKLEGSYGGVTSKLDLRGLALAAPGSSGSSGPSCAARRSGGRTPRS
jgi:MFS family permease